MSDTKAEKGKNYLVSAFFGFIIVSLISFFWKGSIAPFTMYGLWSTRGDVYSWLSFGWPILAWGVGITLFICWLKADLIERSNDPNAPALYLLVGFGISTWAGVMEEICFRWLIFLNSLWMAKVISWMLCGIPEWIYMHIVGPIANFFTLGYMEHLLYHPSGWAVGSAILSTNAFFRDGHKYQGWFGYANSWFIGMFLFWVTIQHGLVASIFLHFLYDFLIFFTVYLVHKVKG